VKLWQVKRVALAGALVALVLALLATPASAGRTLSISKASNVTEDVAKRDCKRDKDCEESNAANCRRLAPKRVSCVASNVGTDEKGAYQCDRLVIVRLKGSGGTKHAAGEPSCYRV
jgi:hypothetical protein